MSRNPVALEGFARRSPRRGAYGRTCAAAALVAAPLAALGLAGAFGLSHSDDPTAIVSRDRAPEPRTIAAASPADHAWLLDPTPSLGAEPLSPWRDAALEAAFQPEADQPEAVTGSLTPPAEPVRLGPSSPLQAARAEPPPPLPTPRPADLGLTAPPQRLADRTARGARTPAATEDNRSFFEKVFGIQQQPTPGTALAYAALGDGAADPTPARRLSPTPAAPGAGVAIYDISARVVHMPNGEKLEVHSGLGGMMDDPRYVHVRMNGATPPGTYDLTEREQLFHGVRALRLNPVGGSAAVHGRAGLLAHTYMLGPSGASNGCVSFRDYNRFLQAYLRGEVRRLVVVSGRGQDGLPGLADKLFGLSNPPAARGDS
jgi:Protein of unknown function (DUF2778)